MGIKFVIDSLDDVDEALRPNYSEGKDGKFYVDVEDDIRRHPKGASLNTSVARLKDEKASLVTKLEELETKYKDFPDDFDAARWAELKDAKSPDETREALKQHYEQKIQAIEAKHAAEKADLTKKAEAKDSDIDRLVGDQGLTAALLEVGVDKRYMNGATALLRGKVKVRKDDDGKYIPYVEEPGLGETALKDFVAAWATTEDGSIYVEKAKGGGAAGGSNGFKYTDNPFDPKTKNLTKQQELVAANPEKARAMAQAVGVKPTW